MERRDVVQGCDELNVRSALWSSLENRRPNAMELGIRLS